MSYEIIVVDDNEAAGKTFARLIQTTTGLATKYVEDPHEAIELVKQDSVKVAVIDQRMPKMTGVTLFEKLRELEPDLRGILFSGEAGKGDLAEAMRARFYDSLDKSDVSQLPERVRQLYFEALAALAERQYGKPERIVERRTGFLARRPRVTIDLLAFEDAPGTPREVWLKSELSLYVRLEGGQTKRISRSKISESELTLETESQVKRSLGSGMTGSLTLPAPTKTVIGMQLQSSLETSLRRRAQQRELIRSENVEEETFTLPEPVAESDPRAREIQRAKIYRRMRAVIRIRCECCTTEKYETFNVQLFTGRYHTRHVDYMRDGSARIVDFE